MTNRLVTGHVHLSDGEPDVGSDVIFDLLTAPALTSAASTIQTRVITTTVDEGYFEAYLAVPDTNSWKWRVTFPDGQRSEFYLEDGGPVNLESILISGSIPPTDDNVNIFEQLIDAHAQVTQQVHGFVDTAEEESHLVNTENPHSVTAAQTGADAAGSASAVQTNLDTHTGDTDNPHGVTAAQVGADPAGGADAVQGNLDAHTGDTDNPHGVTAAQAGADPAGSAAAVDADLIAHVVEQYNLAHALPNVDPSQDPNVAAAMQALADAGILTYEWQYFIDDDTVHDLTGVAGDSVWYPEVIARQAGQVVEFDATLDNVAPTVEFGFDTDEAGSIDANALRISGGDLTPVDGGVNGPDILYPASGGTLQLSVILRAAGAFYMQGDTLLARHGADAATPVYAGFANTDATGAISSVKVPQTLWAPTPTAADTLTEVPPIEDAGSNGLDGTVVNVGLGGPGVGVRVATAASFIELYSAALPGAVDMNEITMVFSLQADEKIAGSENGRVFYWFGNGDNVLLAYQSSTSYVFSYRASGISDIKSVSYTGTGKTVWCVNISGEEMEVFKDGASEGIASDLGNYVAPITSATLGNQTGSTTRGLIGLYSDFVGSLNGAVATPEEVATISGHITAGTITTTILDGIFGAGNYMWLPMDELYTTDGGDLTGIEAGGADVEWTGPTWANTVDGAVNTPTLGSEEVSGTLTVGNWYIITASETDHFYTGSAIDDTFRATATTALDASNKVQQIPTADLFRSISDLASPYAYIEASWTITAGTQAGIVTCLDSATTPENFIIAYHDGDATMYIEKCVAGTYTTLASVAATYSADAPLILRTLPNDTAGVDWWCLYNDAYIANGTVTDAGIVDNILHGLFNTGGNLCPNVNIYPANGHQPPGSY